LTIRAKNILEEVDFILSEDTRTTKKLLNYLGLKNKKIISFYSGNEEKRFNFVIENLKEGKNFALVSEGGTPSISDPGAKIVSLLHKEKLKVVSLPGPTAVTTAYSLSGFRDSDFIFVGFLPRRKKKIIEKLKKYLTLGVPVIFFESPYRIKNTLELIKEFFNNLEVFYIREMTKIYEEYFRGELAELIEYLKSREVKGEITIIVKRKKEERIKD